MIKKRKLRIGERELEETDLMEAGVVHGYL